MLRALVQVLSAMHDAMPPEQQRHTARVIVENMDLVDEDAQRLMAAFGVVDDELTLAPLPGSPALGVSQQ